MPAVRRQASQGRCAAMRRGHIQSGNTEYEIVRKLGVGSFSVVFLALRHDHAEGKGEEVALKFCADGEAHADDIHQEARILRAAQHRNVLEVLAVIDTQEVRASAPDELKKLGPAMVLQPADLDLNRFMRRNGGLLDRLLVRQWAKDLAEGLSHVHRVGVLHRDIKPANIFLFFDGGTSQPGGFVKAHIKLGDFGCATCLPAAGEGACRTRIREKSARDPWLRSLQSDFCMTANVCTAWYRAPELAVGSVSHDGLDMTPTGRQRCVYGAPVDVWSYGAVVYEMLVGKPLARAWTGPGLVACWLGVLGPCFDAGPDAPAYTQHRDWQDLIRAARAEPQRRQRLPEGPLWEACKECLKWHPTHRMVMSDVRRLSWFRAASDDGVPDTKTFPTCPPGNVADRALRLSSEFTAKTSTSTTQCACSGHCRLFKHRSAGECDCFDLVVDTNFCVNCGCKVQGCDRPRHKSDWCYKHRRVLAAVPSGARLAALVADWSHLMLPSSIIDFVNQYWCVRHDIAMCIVLAMIDEPAAARAAVEAWKPLPEGYDGSALYEVIRKAVCASTPDSSQDESWNRPTVDPPFGIENMAMSFGVLRKMDKRAGTSEGELRWKGDRYAFSRDCHVVSDILAAVRECDTTALADAESLSEPTSVLQDQTRFAITVRAVMSELRRRTAAFSIPPNVADSIVRKLRLGRLCCSTKDQTIDWDLVTVGAVREAGCGQELAGVPQDWPASELSAFVCGRPDWPFFACTFVGLWQEVADRLDGAETKIEQHMEHLVRVARGYVDCHGITPHPLALLQEAGLMSVLKRPAAVKMTGRQVFRRPAAARPAT